MERNDTIKSLIRLSGRWLSVIFPLIVIILLIIIFNLISQFEAVSIIFSTLAPFIFSFLLAWILNPIVYKISKKYKLPRWVATVITLLIIILLIVAMFLIIIPEMVYQIKVLIRYVPNIEPAIRDIVNNIEPYLGQNVDVSIFDEIVKNISKVFEKIVSGSLDVITSSISFVGDVLSSIFIGFMIVMAGIYILLDFEKISLKIHSIVPQRMNEDFKFLSKEINRVIVGYLRGLIFETIIVTILSYISIYIAFQIFGAKGALVFACIIGLTNIVPYIGPYIGAIPVSIYALTISFNLFIFIAIIVIVVQQIDGIIVKPKVFGKTTDVHPALSIIAIILFAKLFGLLGIILAIPITGLVIILIRFVYGKLLIKYPKILK